VRVENSTSPSTALPLDSLPLYTEAGVPQGADIFTNMTTRFAEMLGQFDAAEGSNYLRGTNMTPGSFFSVDLKGPSVSLDAYAGGKLYFWIRMNRGLNLGEVIRVEMRRTGVSSASTVGTNTVGGWQGYSRSVTDWQEVSVDLSRFFGGTGPVNVPFIFNTVAASGITIDIDNVRWEKH
jgi:hypothetical protein